MLVYLLFFLFKQKTAYEMRISDWSSDVCSSDLAARRGRRRHRARLYPLGSRLVRPLRAGDRGGREAQGGQRADRRRGGRPRCRWPLELPVASECAQSRSEEHTSELQSLMRISYAVFCLKKKNRV